MEINGIFEIVPDSLYSVKFKGEQSYELLKLFELWRDSDFLEPFFRNYHEDLQNFWGDLTVSEAARITKNESKDLERELHRLAQEGRHIGGENLSMLFKPLSYENVRQSAFEKCKARGRYRKSWLRIYAVRIDVNEYVISGGAIKLTRTMNERYHLLKELEKLECVRKYLREDRNNEFGFFELY